MSFLWFMNIPSTHVYHVVYSGDTCHPSLPLVYQWYTTRYTLPLSIPEEGRDTNGILGVCCMVYCGILRPFFQWIAGLATTILLAVFSASHLFLVSNVQEGAVWVCWINFSVFQISIAICTASLALPSIVVYIIIKHGLSKVKLVPLVAAVAILWVVVLSGLPYLTPAYQFEAFRKGIYHDLWHYVHQFGLCTYQPDLSLHQYPLPAFVPSLLQ